MNVESIHTPWQHWVIDDFLPESDYLHLRNWFDDQPAKDHDGRQMTDSQDVRYPVEIETALHASFLEAMSYTNFRRFGRITYQLDKMLPNESYFGTHCDSMDKLASLVLYVGEPNNGTFMHDSPDSEPVSEIEWRENRAMLFIVQQGITWHSFHNRNTTTPRCTALINIRT